MTFEEPYLLEHAKARVEAAKGTQHKSLTQTLRE
mgnify:CR=1 FL=1